MLTEQEQGPDVEAGLEDEDSGKRMSPADWAQIVDLWELGTASASEICTRFKIKPATLQKRIQRAGIRRGSRAHEVAKANTAATVKAVEKTAEQYAAERKAKVEKVRADSIQWNEMIARQAMQLIASAKQANLPFSGEDKNLKALERTQKIIIAARDELFTLLDAHEEVDDRELPQLVIRDLTDAEIKARRDAQEEDDAEIIDDGEGDLTALESDDDVVIEDGEDDE